MRRFKKILRENEIVLYEYTPTLLKPLYGKIDSPSSLTRRMRFLLEYLSKGSFVQGILFRSKWRVSGI